MRTALLACVLLGACSRVKVVPLAGHRHSALASRTSVDVVVSGRPRCAFDEIALLRVEAKSLEEAIELLRDEARALGGSTVIMRSPTMPLEGQRSFEAIAAVQNCERLAQPQ